MVSFIKIKTSGDNIIPSIVFFFFPLICVSNLRLHEGQTVLQNLT